MGSVLLNTGPKPDPKLIPISLLVIFQDFILGFKKLGYQH